MRAVIPARSLRFAAPRTLACIAMFTLASRGAVAAPGDSPLLHAGDCVAIVGGTFVERMQDSGTLEATLHTARPALRLRFRNLGRSGDTCFGIARKRFDSPEAGYTRLLRDLEAVKASVALVMYGATEASEGPAAVDRFAAGLETLVTDLRARSIRPILVTPVGMPGVRVPGYREAIRRCRRLVRDVAAETRTPVIESNWVPQPSELDIQGLTPNGVGYATYARDLVRPLVGPEPATGVRPVETGVTAELLSAIARKNRLFFHYHRPQNETYLFLFRKHEQGNNVAELNDFLPLIERADQEIWRASADVVPDGL